MDEEGGGRECVVSGGITRQEESAGLQLLIVPPSPCTFVLFWEGKATGEEMKRKGLQSLRAVQFVNFFFCFPANSREAAENSLGDWIGHVGHCLAISALNNGNL